MIRVFAVMNIIYKICALQNVTLTGNIGVHSYTRYRNYVGADICNCKTTLHGYDGVSVGTLAPQTFESSVGKHTCGWSAMRVQGAVRRLQECRRCIRSLAGGWPASLSSRLSSSFPLAQSKIPHAPCCTSATYSGNSTREADHITRLDLPCNAAIVCRAAGCRVETLALTGVPDTDRRPTL